MQFNWKKALWIDRRLPKSSFILRTFVGFYLIYIVYNILNGLKDPAVTNPALVIISAIILGLFSVFCMLSGGLGLYLKEYREMHDDEPEESTDAGETEPEEEEQK